MIFMQSHVLSEAFPQGPCGITQKTSISLAEAEGEVVPSSQGAIGYNYALKGKQTVKHFNGVMKFTPPEVAPSEDTDIRGYKLINRFKPYQVIGGKEMPAKTIKEFRSVMAAKDPKNQERQEKAFNTHEAIIHGKMELMPDTMKPQDIIMATEQAVYPCDDSELYPLQIPRKWGYVNKCAHVVIEPRFDNAKFFEDNLARVIEKGKWGIIDKTGRYIVSPQYTGIGPFEDGLAWITNNKKIGYIDQKGVFVVPIEWDSSSGFKNDVAWHKKNGKDFFIDKNGVSITEDQYCNKRECYHRKHHVHPFEKEGKWGLAETKNKIILQPTFDHIYKEQEGLLRVEDKKRYGFIDRMGNIIIYFQYENALDMKEGVAAVKENGKWGFINKTGLFIIEPRFDRAGNFEDGAAPVSINDKWGLIDKMGRYIIETQFQSGGIWKSSMAVHYNNNLGMWNIQKNTKWGLMDKSGKIIIEPQFDNIIVAYSKSDFTIVEKDHKKGVMNKNGKIIAYPKYTSVFEYPNPGHPSAPNVFTVSKFPYDGYMDISGNLFVITDKVCGKYVVKNRKGEITWPRNIKELCGQKN